MPRNISLVDSKSSAIRSDLEVVADAQVDTVKVVRLGVEFVDRRSDRGSDDPEHIDVGIDLACRHGDFRQNHHGVADPELEATDLVSQFRIHFWNECERIASRRSNVARLGEQTAVLAIWQARQRWKLFVASADVARRRHVAHGYLAHQSQTESTSVNVRLKPDVTTMELVLRREPIEYGRDGRHRWRSIGPSIDDSGSQLVARIEPQEGVTAEQVHSIATIPQEHGSKIQIAGEQIQVVQDTDLPNVSTEGSTIEVDDVRVRLIQRGVEKTNACRVATVGDDLLGAIGDQPPSASTNPVVLAIVEPQTKIGTCTDEHIGSERVVVTPQQRVRWKYRRAIAP